MIYGIGVLIILLGSGGMAFMLSCLYHRRVTDRNLLIGGSLVLINYGLLMVLGLLFFD